MTMVTHPTEVGLPPADESEADNEVETEVEISKPKVKTSFWAAVRIPGVIEYALSYFALKVT